MLAAIVLTLNEEKHLPDCLASLRWADQVVVFDSFSQDATVTLAREAGARVIQHRFENYAAQRNAALEAVPEADWVLFVDADERVSTDLAREIEAWIKTNECAAAWIPRHNYIFGRLTLHAGWYPDYQLRLFRGGLARYDPTRPVHELVQVDGAAAYLNNPLSHLNYSTVKEFVARQHVYTDLEARRLNKQGQRRKPWHYLLQPARHFWWRYIILGGWRDGFHGLRLCALMAYFQFVMLRRAQTLG